MKANEFVDKFLKEGKSLDGPSRELSLILSKEIETIYNTIFDGIEQGIQFDFDTKDFTVAYKIVYTILLLKLNEGGFNAELSKELDKDGVEFVNKYLSLLKK